MKDMSDLEAVKVLHALHGEQFGQGLPEFAMTLTGGKVNPSTVNAILHGALDTATFGQGKALRAAIQNADANQEIMTDPMGNPVGLQFGEGPSRPEDPDVRRALDLEEQLEETAHPYGRLGGQAAGFVGPAVLTAGAGVPAAAGSAAARVGAGAFGQLMAKAAAEGALLNSAYTGGRAYDEGKDAGDIAKDALTGAAIGAAIPGGIYGAGRAVGAAGKGLVNAGTSAARTAVETALERRERSSRVVDGMPQRT